MPGLYSEYAWSCYMFNRLWKMPLVLISQGFEYGVVVYERVTQSFKCLIMAPYDSIYLSMVQYCWIFQNVPEDTWINCSDYARFLNILQYSYNNYYCNHCYYIRILVCSICTSRHSATILSFFNAFLYNIMFYQILKLFKFLEEVSF